MDYTRYFKVETDGEAASKEIITNALLASRTNITYLRVTKINPEAKQNGAPDNPAIAEMTQMASEPTNPQQPTVPIQFVYIVDKGDLYSVDESPNIAACTVEQIGAVLYVRGKE